MYMCSVCAMHLRSEKDRSYPACIFKQQKKKRKGKERRARKRLPCPSMIVSEYREKPLQWCPEVIFMNNYKIVIILLLLLHHSLCPSSSSLPSLVSFNFLGNEYRGERKKKKGGPFNLLGHFYPSENHPKKQISVHSVFPRGPFVLKQSKMKILLDPVLIDNGKFPVTHRNPLNMYRCESTHIQVSILRLPFRHHQYSHGNTGLTELVHGSIGYYKKKRDRLR